MKRVFAAITACVLIFGSVGIAADFVWDSGGADNDWDTTNNWDVTPAYPGSGIGTSTTSYRMDRAKINTCETGGVEFDSNSGDESFSSYLASRNVPEIVLESDTNNVPVGMLVSGDKLLVEHFVIKSNADSGDVACLSITNNGSLEVDRLEVSSFDEGAGAFAQLDVGQNFSPTELFVREGRLELDVDPGYKLSSEVTIISGQIQRTSVALPTCP